MSEVVAGYYPYVMVGLLLLIGFHAMAMKRNYMKKVIGLTIFQTAIYLLFIQGAAKTGATIPVRATEFGTAAADYINPLPQVIVLTAIVVGVATTGVALSLMLQIHRRYGSLDEKAILKQVEEEA
jgi:multicomponent Na+:H+ antiporter subunit C